MQSSPKHFNKVKIFNRLCSLLSWLVGRLVDRSVGWSIGLSISESFWSDLASYRLFLGADISNALASKLREN